MTTTQHTRTVDRQPAADPTRRAATIVGWLFIVTYVTLRQDYAAADEQSAAGLAAVGDAFLVMQEWTFNLGPAFVVGVGNGLILGWMMFRSGLVPRRLAVLGLIGGTCIVATGSAAVLGLIEPGGAIQQLSAAPEFFWELGLGIYLIVKGFKTPGADAHGAMGEPAVTR
jgi:hypothetical protein